MLHIATLHIAEISLSAKYNKVMEIDIAPELYQQALTYAQQRGLKLNSVIEDFLIRFIGKSKKAKEQAVPDIVLSLLGAEESVADDDINAHEAYYD